MAGTGTKMVLPHSSVCRTFREQSAGSSAGSRPIRSEQNSIATSGPEPAPVAFGWCSRTYSIATSWTSGSRVGAAKTPSSCGESLASAAGAAVSHLARQGVEGSIRAKPAVAQTPR